MRTLGNGLVLNAIAKSHLDVIHAIERRAYPVPWSYGVFFDCLVARYDCQALWRGDRVLGYFIGQRVLDEAHLLNVCVDPDCQHQGLGELLMQEWLLLAASSGCGRALLEVRVSNLSAQALYQKLGFKQIGYRKGYYPALEGREDGIVMALMLKANGGGMV
jgi:[ribosomal protein S18]-alanine N-acetyltransferase